MSIRGILIIKLIIGLFYNPESLALLGRGGGQLETWLKVITIYRNDIEKNKKF
ncbi:MAG: hypothetical protein QXW20_07450 [Ignisphaera sp.]